MNKGIGQYKQIGVETALVNASPHRLIQMLYEGALTQLANAKGAIQNDQIELLSVSIKKTSNILIGLEEGLDLEKGGEIASNLQALYRFLQTELIAAQSTQSVEKIDAMISVLVELKSAWDAIEPGKISDETISSDKT
ncbi:Flagellar biosynthesis protein FliS [Nitrincola lacisaponensis]|uniref:Flagellar secretion chaperone FliS n=1 Tax=Nitrincola lacisaponensis TaxID=267850 RepID=A0A063Y465_9GAMM|nr:flagellar export chaperone FliS [Nitrincola lacisaponensis]KDE40449.1 Flagellar biosynthesis protein FliS [Nitrincola lacisaponensis]